MSFTGCRWVFAVGVMALVAGACSGDSVPSIPSSTVQPIASTSANEAATPTSEDLEAPTDGWQAVAGPVVFGGPGEQEMRDVVASDGIFVGVGMAQGDDAVDVGRSDAAVWVSLDGAEWVRVGAESVFSELGAQSLLAVTRGGPGFVAVGAAERTHQDDPAVWVSQDGLVWSRVEDSTGAFATGTFAQMWDVVAGGPGLVAVGFAGAVDTFDAAVWVSSDAVTWERVTSSVLAGAGNEFMVGAAVLGGGRLVVVGNEGGDSVPIPAVWTTDDGLAWERSASVPLDIGSSMFDVVVWDGGVVAVGRDESGDDLDAAVWVSPDGDTWRRVEDASLGGPGDQVMSAVTTVGNEIIAVGYERVTERNAIVWRSTDGATWTRTSQGTLSAEGFQEMFSVAADNDHIVAVGYSGSIAQWDAAAWIHAR